MPGESKMHISSVSHIALQVPDLEASAAYATSVLGLCVTERSDDVCYLTHGRPHHSLELIQGQDAALDHVGFFARDGAAMEALREALDVAGVELIDDEPPDPGLDDAIRFAGPAGHVFEVHLGMQTVDPAYVPSGVRPLRLQHINLKAEELGPTTDFLCDVLGFAISDYIGEQDPLIIFFRCNSEHHTVGLSTGPDGLFHYAFEVSSVEDLARLGDVLDGEGKRFVWGPGKHGAGDNIATYHLDPSGALVEYFAQMMVIPGSGWEPRRWSVDDYHYANLWGPIAGLEELVDLGLPLTRRETAADA